MRPETLDRQIDGDHYKKMGLQPWEIIEKNDLDYFHGAVLKYLLRWQDKDGVIDLDKIIHYIEHIKALALSGHYGERFKPMPLEQKSELALLLEEQKKLWGDARPFFNLYDPIVDPLGPWKKHTKSFSKTSSKPKVKRSVKKRSKVTSK